MQVTLKTENAHDNMNAYDCQKVELYALGDQTALNLQAEGVCGMSVTAYVRSNHFDAEVGKVPERFQLEKDCREDDAYGWNHTRDLPMSETPRYCEVSWIDPKTGLATPHNPAFKPVKAAYLATCKTAHLGTTCVGVCQAHYDSYVQHGVQTLTNWDFEKL